MQKIIKFNLNKSLLITVLFNVGFLTTHVESVCGQSDETKQLSKKEEIQIRKIVYEGKLLIGTDHKKEGGRSRIARQLIVPKELLLAYRKTPSKFWSFCK